MWLKKIATAFLHICFKFLPVGFDFSKNITTCGFWLRNIFNSYNLWLKQGIWIIHWAWGAHDKCWGRDINKCLWRKKNIYRLRIRCWSLSISCHGPLVDVHWLHRVPLILCFSWQKTFYWPLSQSKLFSLRQCQTTKFDPILISQSLG